MQIVVAGGTGFLGTALVEQWRRTGHQVKVLTRRPQPGDDVRWAPEAGSGAWTTVIEGSDAVVNLAGEGIADAAWTPQRKAAIRDSRVIATRALSQAIRASARPPRVFVSGSAIGFYGTHGDEPLTESSAAGSDFLAAVCQAWEEETQAAEGAARIILLRTGLVLDRRGGALPRMARPFRFFAGGRAGSGRQYLSWIHLADWTGLVQWALENDAVRGPLNLTAPSPVTNAEFTGALARAMHRPARLPAPAFALRLLLGQELADALILGGQRVLPAKAQQLGYQFRYPELSAALDDIMEP